MPFALVFIGMVLIVTGFQNTYQKLGTLVAGDFTGTPNFFTWFVAIAIIGGIGYYKPLETPSRAFMGLIIAVLILSKGTGFFSQLQSGVTAAGAQSDQNIGAPLPASGGSTSASDSSSSNPFGNIGQDVSIAATVASFF